MSIKCKTGTIIAYFMHTKIWNEHIADSYTKNRNEYVRFLWNILNQLSFDCNL